MNHNEQKVNEILSIGNFQKYLFKYMRVDKVSQERLGDLDTLFCEKKIRYYNDNDDLKNWAAFTQIVSHNTLYFSRYTYLNDPYECIMNINYSQGVADDVVAKFYSVIAPHVEEKAREHQLSFDQLQAEVRDFTQNKKMHFYKPASTGNALPFSICSLSDDPCNIQMWSYYGINHTGICVAFEIDWKQIISAIVLQFPDATPTEIIDIMKDNGIKFNHTDKNERVVEFGLQRVQYQQAVPNYPVDRFMKAFFDEECKHELSWLLTGVKQIGWSHESEWRLVCFSRYSEEASDLLPLGAINFIKPCGIILGASMDKSIGAIIHNHYSHLYPIIKLEQEINDGILSYSLVPNAGKITALLGYPAAEVLPSVD